jgi:predicted Zn-dependent protease
MLSLFVEANFQYAKRTISEDELIIRAIFYDEYALYENSYIVYKKLFDETGESIYLYKEAQSALWSQKFILESIERLVVLDKKYPDTVEIKRLLVSLYLTARQVKNAKKEAIILLSLSKKVLDLDLSASAFMYSGEYAKALTLLNRAYIIDGKESILLRMVAIMDEFTHEGIKAIGLLEKHRRMNHVSKEMYNKLLLLYKREKDIQGILSTYIAMYEVEAKEEYLQKIIDAYVYLNDIKGATLFLEKYEVKPKILYDLYKIQEEYKKAIALIDTLYSKDKNAKWIAEKGVLLFEIAEDKDDVEMIKDVLAYLEKAIALGNDDSLYLNYYGYTLIDKEVDIQKGIKVIEDALLQQPNNTYYLDSLAWGYYKENKCSKAYVLMKRVVEEEGLEEEEILTHWNAIRECK